MDATTTEPITSLIKQLIVDSTQLPAGNLTFSHADDFGWNHSARTIFYNPKEPNAPAYLLHEYGHALLSHDSHIRDISLIAMERAAWDEAVRMAPHYHVTIDNDMVESALDTYRDWLHARSACPTCATAGVQIQHDIYRCLACQTQWRVNDARACALRRYKVK